MSYGPLLFIVAAALALVGCQAGANLGVSCTRASDCRGGLVCRFGRCRSECTTNAECTAGSSCFLAGDGTGACSLDVDHTCTGGTGVQCPTGLTCVAEHCVQTCTTSADCPRDGECQPVPGATVSFCFDPRVTFDAGTGDAGSDAAVQSDAGADAGMDSGADAAAGDGGPDAGFTTPVPAPADVCVGGGFACAIVSGEVHCWGDQKWGALGQPLADCANTAVAVDQTVAQPVLLAASVMPLGPADEIACGSEFACAHLTNGQVWCWGRNDVGQLGPMAAGMACSAAPIHVTGLPTTASQLLVSDAQACVLDSATGSPICWGLDRGVLGTPGPRAMPGPSTTAPDAGAPLRILGIGPDYACAVTQWGDVTCWGNGARGQTSIDRTPLPSHVRTLAAGQFHVLAGQGTSDLLAWGDHSLGEIPDPPDGSVRVCGDAGPCAAGWITSPDHARFATTQGAARFSCAIVGGDAHVDCWGENRALQSGAPDPSDAGVNGLGDSVLRSDTGAVLTGVMRIYVGFENACARPSDGSLWCWGANDRGQLQRATTGPSDGSATAILMTP